MAATAQGANVSEYVVKADYLSYFTQFVRWPKAAFTDKDAPFVLGILGDDPFGKTLDDAVRGKSAEGHPLTVKRFGSFDKDQLEALRNCQIVLISDSEQHKVREILSDLSGANLLTVSEIDHFPMKGGMIQFVPEGDNIGLLVNPKTAIQAKLKLSSQLMMVSKIYMDVNADKVKALYYDGIQLYINGQVKEAIVKWKECLQEDPGNLAAQDKIKTARAKLKAISHIKY